MRRYGIRPGELVAMPWGDWEPIRRAGVRAEHDESRERWTQSAFIAWSQGAGPEGGTFGDYLKSLGLTDAHSSDKRARKVDQQRAIDDARRIMAKDPQRRAGGG